jgi:pimeloyl-ACP methyl ester carboxylesterase
MTLLFNRREAACLLAGTVTAPALSARAWAAQSIDRSDYVKLGGIEQWISIKGEDTANPVLLVVHGGPADVQWPNADKYVPWQKDFTVVQWDQRGAGHTYGHSGGDKIPDVNLGRIVRDGIELAEYLIRDRKKKKIILLGHSWGSVVGALMAAARPELFAAYVGTGQVESWTFNVKSQFDTILAHARATNDTATIKELEAIGTPDPKNTHQYFTFSRNFRSLWAQPDQAWLAHLRAQAATLKGTKDFDDDQNGQLFTDPLVLPDQVKTDLSVVAAHIGTEIFIIQGADDVITPVAGARDYFAKIEAPHKEFIAIPHAGHFAFMTSDAFLPALTDKVRPVAIARGA